MLHTGAHKINNALGQALLAKRMGKPRLIAETGAGQHGVATATVAARFGFSCDVYMGEEDTRRQSLNVFRMKLLGANVIPVTSGSKTLKDATNEAMRDWVTNVRDTHYIIGSVVGPHPFPEMVRDFHAVTGQEARAQIIEQTGKLPDACIACVGGGSNAMGLFHPFVEDEGVKLIGVEAAGDGLDSGQHAAPLNRGSKGVLHGSLSYIMQDNWGQITETHSISAGLDLSGRRAGTRAFERDGPRPIWGRDRRGRARSVGIVVPFGGHFTGAGNRARVGVFERHRAQNVGRSDDYREFVGARRQGHQHGDGGAGSVRARGRK